MIPTYHKQEPLNYGKLLKLKIYENLFKKLIL